MGSLFNEQVNKIINYVLANSLVFIGVTLVLYHLFNHTLCVRYFTELILGSFGNVTVNKIRHCVLAILLGLFRDHYVTSQ